MTPFIQKLGILASFLMPFFNIPLILHIVKRKSSDDISLTWLLGVWLCIVAMFPATWISHDPAFKVFGIVNIIFFSLVVAVSLKYRKPK